MKSKYIVPIIIVLLLIGFVLVKSNGASPEDSKKENPEEISVTDSIKNKRSEEIMAALRKDGEFSPLDYAFMVKELEEINSTDTLFYVFTVATADFRDTASDSIFLGTTQQLKDSGSIDTKYLYFPTGLHSYSGSQDAFVSDVIKMERATSILRDSSNLGTSTQTILALAKENSKINVDDIPDQYLSYDLRVLENYINAYAFSEVVGEEEILDFLIKDTENTLKVIEQDSLLSTRYNAWLEDLVIYYSEDYPAELQARKLDYLIEKLQQSQHPYAEKTLKVLDNVKIVKRE